MLQPLQSQQFLNVSPFTVKPEALAALGGREATFTVGWFRVLAYMALSENKGGLFWGPYNKDPTI